MSCKNRPLPRPGLLSPLIRGSATSKPSFLSTDKGDMMMSYWDVDNVRKDHLQPLPPQERKKASCPTQKKLTDLLDQFGSSSLLRGNNSCPGRKIGARCGRLAIAFGPDFYTGKALVPKQINLDKMTKRDHFALVDSRKSLCPGT